MAPLDPESPRFTRPNFNRHSFNRHNFRRHRQEANSRAFSVDSMPETVGLTVSNDTAAIAEMTKIASERRSMARATWVAIIAIAIFWVASTARGQDAGQPAAGDYDVVAMLAAFKDPGTLKKTRTGASAFSRGNSQFNPGAVRAYYTRYVPAIFSNPANAAEMGKLVQELNDHIGRAARNPAVMSRLNEYLYQGLSPIAAGNYYPPARVAAISILGQLNSKPLNSQNKTAPVPYQKSLTVIWPLVSNPDQPDGVRAAAIAALHRYIMLTATVSPQIAARVSEEMEKFIDEPKPENRSAEVHAYLQRFAVDVLKRLKPANDATLGTQLISIALDEKSLDMIAFHSAGKLGDMTDALKADTPDAQKVVSAWSKRLLNTLETEYARLMSYRRPTPAMSQPRDPASFLGRKETVDKTRPRGMASGVTRGAVASASDFEMEMDAEALGIGMEQEMTMGSYGGMGLIAKPQPAEVIAARQKINYALEQLNLGMVGKRSAGIPEKPRGIYAALAEADRQVVDQWITATQGLSDIINDKSLDDQTKFELVLLEQIEQLKLTYAPPEDGDEAEGNGFEDALAGGDLLGGNPAAGKPAGGAPAIEDLEAEF